MKRWYMYTETTYASWARMIPEATAEQEAVEAAQQVYFHLTREGREKLLAMSVGLAEAQDEFTEPEPETVVDVLSRVKAYQHYDGKLWYAICYTEDASGECRAHTYPLDAVDISEAVADALKTWTLLPYDMKQMAYTFTVARVTPRDVVGIAANGDYVPDTTEGYLNLFPTIGTVFGWC